MHGAFKFASLLGIFEIIRQANTVNHKRTNYQVISFFKSQFAVEIDVYSLSIEIFLPFTELLGIALTRLFT